MSYSTDFIGHILHIKKTEKLSFRATAKRFNVSVPSIQKWEKGIFPSKTRNKPPTKIPNDWLIQDVKDYPDAFQHERAQRLGVSPKGIGQALARLKITRKKRPLDIQKQTKPKESSTD